MGKVLYWIAVIPLVLIVIVFSVSNHAPVDLSLWPLLTQPVPFPVYGLALVCLGAGFVVGAIVSWFQAGGTRKRARALQRRLAKEEQELASLRDRAARLNSAEVRTTIPLVPQAAPDRAESPSGVALAR
ncbi:MAG: LapA family protein [Rhodospirillales bacterium]|nr:LapA family protein [Rhodospirillales bacterium]